MNYDFRILAEKFDQPRIRITHNRLSAFFGIEL